MNQPYFLANQQVAWNALGAGAQCPELVRAIIVGDSPIDMDGLVEWMTSAGFKYFFSALRALSGLDLSIAELTRRIADIHIQVPGQEAPIRYGDRPDIYAVQIQQWALTVSHMDPGIL